MEREIIVSLLKLTINGVAQRDQIRNETRISSRALNAWLNRLSDSGLILCKHGLVEALPRQRLSLAMRALELGADYEKIARLLSWIEFESMTAQVFESNGYKVLSNFHFQNAKKRWQMDVLGCREPLIICVDCKHWQRKWSRSAVVEATKTQIKRTQALASALPNYHTKMKLGKWKEATLIPLVLSLIPGPFKFLCNTPIVSVLQLHDFINHLPTEAIFLTSFSQNALKSDRELTDYCKPESNPTNPRS